MKLVKRLREDFPDILFELGEENLWLPEENKIIFREDDGVGLLHELGHALCGHSEFIQDIELIHAECDAWEKAKELGEAYGVEIDEERIEAALEWYRDWLHQRSICPVCGQNGIQSRENGSYSCLNCDTSWKANDARQTGLRRKKQNTPKV